MFRHALSAATALIALGAVVQMSSPAEAWSRAKVTHHPRIVHHQASATQGNDITSFSSSSGVVSGGVGVNHPPRR